MKIHQLIKKLEKFDPNLHVVQSSDPEGNHFHPSSTDIQKFHYLDGELYENSEEDPAPKGSKEVVVIFAGYKL